MFLGIGTSEGQALVFQTEESNKKRNVWAMQILFLVTCLSLIDHICCRERNDEFLSCRNRILPSMPSLSQVTFDYSSEMKQKGKCRIPSSDRGATSHRCVKSLRPLHAMPQGSEDKEMLKASMLHSGRRSSMPSAFRWCGLDS